MPDRVRPFWTPERLLRLQQLAPKYSASEIAIAIPGATRNAVIGACNRYGIDLVPSIEKQQRGGLATARIKHERQGPKVALPRQEPAMPIPTHNPQPVHRPLTIMELQNHHCREIVAYSGREAMYCGATRYSGCSYCRRHAMKNIPGMFARYVRPQTEQNPPKSGAAW